MLLIDGTLRIEELPDHFVAGSPPSVCLAIFFVYPGRGSTRLVALAVHCLLEGFGDA